MRRRRRGRLPPLFTTEAELCQLFIEHARVAGYAVHCEVSGWDVLLVDRATGEQVGVQAKLRPSVDVLMQAMGSLDLDGPDIHVVLVPTATVAFEYIARELNLVPIEGAYLKSALSLIESLQRAPHWKHRERVWVPEVEVIHPAGVPAPKTITPWKLSAVKLCLLARRNGYVTSAEMKALKLDRKWWFDPKFGPVLAPRVIELAGGFTHPRGEYVLHDPSSRVVPDLRWPEITTALKLVQQLPASKGPRLRRKRSVGVLSASG
jgi:hypothetical protein